MKRDYKIDNLVYSFDLKQKIPLEEAYRNMQNSEYEPETFPGLKYRADGVILIFNSGKGSITSVKSLKKAKEILIKFLEELGISNKNYKLKLVNSTITTKIEPPDLLLLSQNPLISYNPEINPHAVLKSSVPIKYTAVIVKTGHVYIVGIRSLNRIKDVINHIKKEVNMEENL